MQSSLMREALRLIGYGVWIIVLLVLADFTWINYAGHEYRASLIGFVILILAIQGGLGVQMLNRRLSEKAKRRAIKSARVKR
ncbi:MAG: hypothetical protein ACE5OY_08925 [Candidatus Bathyarchaeia archaeon]